MKKMKSILSAIVIGLIVVSNSVYGQTFPPKFIGFSGKAMNGSTPVTAPFALIVKILEDTPTGTSKYEEVFYSVQPDVNGMYKVNIGGGIVTAGNWGNISWSTKYTYLWVAVDVSNTGSATGLTPSITQFLSVPYSFYAEESGGGSIEGAAGWLLKFNNTKSAENSSIFQSGDNIQMGFHGIPSWEKNSVLQVSSYKDLNSYFSSYAPSNAGRAIKAEFLTTNTDGIAVEGKSALSDYWGIGGKFIGGWIGLEATVNPTGSGYYTGIRGMVNGGISGKTGYGVYGVATGNGTNIGVYGSTSGGSTNYAGYFNGNVTVTGTFVNVSDGRFKKDVQPVSNALSTIMKLEPKTYSFNTQQYKSMNLPEGKHYGFIAQELETIMPELVTNNVHAAEYNEKKEKISDEIKFKAVNYIEMVSILVASVQEQQQIIEKLQAEMEKLKQSNSTKK